MQFTAPISPSSFREDITCGFFGGAMAGFNAGVWLLPRLGLLNVGQTILLCIASGFITGLWLVKR